MFRGQNTGVVSVKFVPADPCVRLHEIEPQGDASRGRRHCSEEIDVFRRTIRALATFLAIAIAADLAVAGQPAKPAASKLPTISDFANSMAVEDYAGAQRMAGVLLQTGGTAERAAVSLSYGRILLAQGDKKGFTEYRKNMRKLKLTGNDLLLMDVYDAWEKAIAKPAERDAAIQTLEEIVRKQQKCEPTAEAAEVLARLYTERGDTVNAKRAVDGGLAQFSDYHPLQTAYIERILRNRLKAKETEAEKLYAAAEKLRNDKKYLEAGRVYTQVQATYPKDVLRNPPHSGWASASSACKGRCRPWNIGASSLKSAPAGPWRGQARVGRRRFVVGPARPARRDRADSSSRGRVGQPAAGRGCVLAGCGFWHSFASGDHCAFDGAIRTGRRRP